MECGMRNDCNIKLIHPNRTAFVILITALSVTVCMATTAFGDTGDKAVLSLIGSQDSLLVVDPNGEVVVAKNDMKKLLPALILKIFTSLVAMHYLGPDYRFRTEFFLDNEANLKIKGFGDPRLVSEVVQDISRLLAALLGQKAVINDLVVDDAYFIQPLTIPINWLMAPKRRSNILRQVKAMISPGMAQGRTKMAR